MGNGSDYNRIGKLKSSMGDETTVKQVTGGHYGEDLPDEKRSANAREYMSENSANKRKGYPDPATGEVGGEEVQGKLEAIGGGSAEAVSFPLY